MYSEILKATVGQIFERIILRKYIIKFSLTFGNNLREKGFENFEQIGNYSEILRKFQNNYETEDNFSQYIPTIVVLFAFSPVSLCSFISRSIESVQCLF